MAEQSSTCRMLAALAASLMVILLLALPAIQADKRVNLIFPLIKKATLDKNCHALMNNCTLDLWTRAGHYRLADTDLLHDTTGSLVRVGDWKQPQSLIDSDFYLADGGRGVKEQAAKAREALKQAKIPDGFTLMAGGSRGPASAFLLCEAYTKFVVGKEEAYVCIRDNSMHIKIGDKYFENSFDIREYNLPISAIVSQVLPAEKKQDDFLIRLISFDMAGVVTISESRYILPELQINFTKSRQWLLSPIRSPAATGNQEPPLWLRGISDIELSAKLADKLDAKTRSAYVQSITEEGWVYGTDTTIDSPIPLIPVVKEAQESSIGNGAPDNDDDEAQVMQPVGPPAEPLRTPLCFNQRPMNPNENFACMVKNQRFKFNPGYRVGDLNAAVSVHAHHREKRGTEVISHMAYSIASGSTYRETRYMFCRMKMDSTEIQLDVASSFPGSGDVGNCIPVTISLPPNDIIGFKSANCSRTIAFYDSIYTVHPDDKSIYRTDIGPPKILDGIDFYINAAFAHIDTIYFFTGTNTLVSFSAKFASPACDSLILDLATKEVQLSQEYLYPRAFQADGEPPLGPPYLFDWREYAENDTDTLPSILSAWNAAPNGGNKTDSPPPAKPKPKESSDSNVVIIAVGLILGGLIIAAIVYLFCLRGNNGDERPPLRRIKSRRAKTAGAGLDTNEAMSSMKTVRSEHNVAKSPLSNVGSKVGGSSMGPQKSRGSRRSKRSAGAKQPQPPQQPQQPPQQQQTSAAAAPSTSASAAPAAATAAAGAGAAAPATSISIPKAASKSPKSQSSSPTAGGFLKKTIGSPKSPSSPGKSTNKSKYNIQSPKAAKTSIVNP